MLSHVDTDISMGIRDQSPSIPKYWGFYYNFSLSCSALKVPKTMSEGSEVLWGCMLLGDELQEEELFASSQFWLLQGQCSMSKPGSPANTGRGVSQGSAAGEIVLSLLCVCPPQFLFGRIEPLCVRGAQLAT